MSNATATRSLRPKQAAEFLGVGVATLWRWSANRQDFPKPRRLSARCTVFDSAELTAWRDSHSTGEVPSVGVVVPTAPAGRAVRAFSAAA